MNGSNPKSQKATFIFTFLDALKRDPEMKPRDAFAALFFIEIVGDDFRFFMSARRLADLMRCEESTAEASLGRFRAREYLLIAETPKATSGENGGRLANTYVMSIPDAVSPEKSVKTCLRVSPGKSGNTTKPLKEVSPEKSGKVSPEKSGTITRKKSLEGGRAPKGAPANSIKDVYSVIIESEDRHLETDAAAENGSEALEEPLAASVDPADPDAWRSDPDFATGSTQRAFSGKLGRAADHTIGADPGARSAPGHTARRKTGLAELGLAVDDIERLSCAMAFATAEGAQHRMTAHDLAVAYVSGFMRRDGKQRRFVVDGVASALAPLAALLDEDRITPREHLQELADCLRAIAQKAHRAAPGAIDPKTAVSAFIGAFPEYAPEAAEETKGGLATPEILEVVNVVRF
ncbi:hypothetical protein [Gemmobacter serpentinus]|uniref:hypothetical protein n=1 Tax=Gemmobacter serpentinus TaxID=2652247 RepID=UPI00124DF176|nr:hypothetical protein [Gemmobacter serpentinus]